MVAGGGALGIAAELVTALASRFRPKIYLLGGNPLNLLDRDAYVGDDMAFLAQRPHWIRRRLAARPGGTVATLNDEFDQMVNARTARHNIDRMTRYCGANRVRYLTCDVRDRDAVTGAIGTVLAAEPRVDLLINAAGRNRSKPFVDKGFAEFRNIRDLKVRGYLNLNLKHALRHRPPTRWCNLRAVRACGVKTRRHCRPLAELGEATPGERVRWHFSDVCDLGEAAARQAFAAAGLAATDVHLLITVTSAGYRMPGMDIALIERLGLVPTVRRMPMLYMGCSGGPYALTHAVTHAALHPDQVILVVFADMFLHFLHPEDTGLDSMIFRGLMGDGAAACVVRSGDDGHGPSIIDSWSYTQPGTSDIVGYRLDDDGFHEFNSARLLTTLESLVPRLAEWLGEPPQFVVAHPGGPRILRILADGLPNGAAMLDKARQSLAEHGNMGAPSTMDILARTFDDPPPPGSRGVLIGVGPGVTMTACLADWL